MLDNKRKAFTMIELVFVIVVLGILAAIAIPKLAATRDDAYVSQAMATVASVRSGIVTERQKRLFQGDSSYMNDGNLSNAKLFDGAMQSGGITASSADGHWSHSGTTYTFNLANGSLDVTYTYNAANGTFLCTAGACSDYGE